MFAGQYYGPKRNVKNIISEYRTYVISLQKELNFELVSSSR